MSGADDHYGQDGHEEQAGKRIEQDVDHCPRTRPTGRLTRTLVIRHELKPTDGAYIYTKEVSVQFLLLVLIVAGLAYVAWRFVRAANNRPRTRVIGPDDDPDFLNRINHGKDPR